MLTLANRPVRESKVPNRIIKYDGHDHLLVVCPNCHVHYAAADFLERLQAARERGEDLVLTDADVNRDGIGATRPESSGD
ncbi:3-deoxy-D-arabino-heptulosonate 7-phosphate (DAHP) synthase [Nocardioides salarius]|uniref:3-deoxy-D-arabino-heptulosonate 7-phosphate (DAHP) synthase n=1 Tax=Nocardioides salarius TaxID=374513 RepID=A0ABS2M5T1_9ACTN|nr:hypothetical protein [Nocardioides salarius]MBM7506549.1 3-deoxy-D-arabino-heptulosonate 7-phosphate (DAHP) synthase [Nocardioides salarius]